MNHAHLTRHGMTLIEILAVVIILGLLAVTLTAGLAGKLGKAKHEIARTQIAQIVGQVEAYRLDRQRVPTAAEGLAVLATDPGAIWYLEASKQLDPWGRPYRYLVPGPQGQAYEVVTYGGDGQPGGQGESADLTSAELGR